MKLNMQASAVLVWLPEGEIPTIDSFPDNVEPPPSPNPEPWWSLADAIVYARDVDRTGHNKVSWIKTGDTLLSQEEIFRAYSGILAARAFDDARGS
jgi:hypothetical protein